MPQVEIDQPCLFPNRKLGYVQRGHHACKDNPVAKSQKKSNKEVRKPKAEKAPKTNASNPSSKTAAVSMVTIKS
jgi:hypothetical protein